MTLLHIHIGTVHANYALLAIVSISIITGLYMARKWISEALSDDGRASSKRLGGFLLVITMCFCELYTTFRTQKFDLNHLIVFTIAIMLCWGIATMTQIIDAYKGNKNTKTEETKVVTTPPDITTTTVKTETPTTT